MKWLRPSGFQWTAICPTSVDPLAAAVRERSTSARVWIQQLENIHQYSRVKRKYHRGVRRTANTPFSCVQTDSSLDAKMSPQQQSGSHQRALRSSGAATSRAVTSVDKSLYY
jgi:hypothetical protein